MKWQMPFRQDTPPSLTPLKSWLKWTENGQYKVLLVFRKIQFFFPRISVTWQFMLLALCLYNSHVWVNYSSWVMSQNVFSHSGCRIINLVFENADINLRNTADGLQVLRWVWLKNAGSHSWTTGSVFYIVKRIKGRWKVV